VTLNIKTLRGRALQSRSVRLRSKVSVVSEIEEF